MALQLRDAMQIFVEIIDDKTITLEVEASDTILSVKAKIQEKEDIPPNQQHLHQLEPWPFMSNVLTLSDYYVQEGDMLYLVRSGMQIFVKLWDDNDKTITMDVVPRDPIAFIKAMLQAEEGIPKDQQVLIFAGRTLEDGRRLVDYNIRHGAMLYQMLRLRGSMQTL